MYDTDFQSALILCKMDPIDIVTVNIIDCDPPPYLPD